MVFADFRALNTPIKAEFKAPMYTELAYKFCGKLTIGFYEPEQAGSSIPLPLLFSRRT